MTILKPDCAKPGCTNDHLPTNRYCRDHRNEYMRKWLQTPKGKRINKRATVFWRYGITLEEVEALLKAQGGVCLICGRRPKPPCIDHDHQTGKICGVLCRACNSALGQMEDDPERLEEAAAYLRQTRRI